MVRQTIQKTAWLAKQFNRSEGLWRSYIQNAGKAFNTPSASTYNWPWTLPTPVSDTIFFSPETYTQARITIPYCPSICSCLPQTPSDQFFYSHYFKVSLHCFLLCKGGVTAGRGAWTSRSYTAQSGTTYFFPPVPSVFGLLSINSLRPREDMFFTGRHVSFIYLWYH